MGIYRNRLIYEKSLTLKSKVATDLGKLSSIFKPVLDRFNDLEEEQQEEFKSLVKQFLRLYSYVTQIIRLFDEELHSEFFIFINFG